MPPAQTSTPILAGGLLYTEGGHWTNDVVTNTYLNRMRTNLSLQQQTGVWTNKFAYDAAKRLTNVTSQAGSFTNEYFAGVAGASGYSSRLIKRLLLPNTSIITNDYDSTGRQLGTWLRTSAGVNLDSATYGYNTANQRTTFTNTASTNLYTYDNIGQLTVADSLVNSEDRQYVYDAAWNLSFRTNNTTAQTFKVDNKNQLTNGTPEGTVSYDDNGNPTFASTTFFGYVYDDENRLVKWYYYANGSNGNGNPSTHADLRTDFVYDGLGRLRKRVEYQGSGSGTSWHLESETRYIYDGMRVIQERSSSNIPTVSYTRGNDLSGTLEGAGGIGGLLARSDGYSSGNWSTHNFYHADGNGNITYLVNSSQGLAASYRYEPFGKTLASSGTVAAANVYRFSSKEVHANSGMYYFGYRFYDPDSQRWTGRDPLQENADINMYRFVFNSPPDEVDPLGLNCLSQCLGEALGLGAVVGTGLTVGGLPSLPKPFRTPGSSVGTSPISKCLSKAFPQKLPFSVPAPTWARPGAMSPVIGRIAGRWLPLVGWALLVKDAAVFAGCMSGCQE